MLTGYSSKEGAKGQKRDSHDKYLAHKYLVPRGQGAAAYLASHDTSLLVNEKGDGRGSEELLCLHCTKLPTPVPFTVLVTCSNTRCLEARKAK